jgi:outer membrane protein assembly factor BamB
MFPMRPTQFVSALTVLILAAAVTVRPADNARPGIDWPSFRGINGHGTAEGFPTATAWNVPLKQGVVWSAEVAGLGHSSPIIWGNRLCVTTAISGRTDAGLKPGIYGNIESVNDDTSHEWKLLCYDKKSGKTLLDKSILSGVPKVKRHTKSTHANSTLATDGTHLIAMLGSEGLYAFDMNGKELWKKDFGVLDSGFYMAPTAQWEFASSPVIYDGKVVIQADVQKGSFLAAFDAPTGKELWRTPRQDVPTWSTPAVHVVGGKPQIVVNGWKHTGGYDLATGKEIWKLNGGGDIPVPVPVVGHGLVFITNAHGPMSPIYAIRETATGDISLPAGVTTNEHIAWSVPRDGAYLISPVLYKDVLYVTKTQGVINAFDAKTGEKLYQERLGGGTTAFTSSTIAADGKVYFTSEEGDVYVVKAGRTFELLATNPLGGITMASPAVSEGVLYFRTANRIIAVK